MLDFKSEWRGMDAFSLLHLPGFASLYRALGLSINSFIQLLFNGAEFESASPSFRMLGFAEDASVGILTG
jgi:hypothetical protein